MRKNHLQYAGMEIEIENLRNDLRRECAERNILEVKVSNLAGTVQELQLQLTQQSNLIKMYDLICLFEFYFVAPHLSRLGYSSWKDLLDQYADVQARIEDKKCDENECNLFKQPINDLLPESVDVEDLIKTSKLRHDVSHSDLRSTTSQKTFIQLCNNTIKFEDNQELATKLLQSLQTVKLRRKS